MEQQTLENAYKLLDHVHTIICYVCHGTSDPKERGEALTQAGLDIREWFNSGSLPKTLMDSIRAEVHNQQIKNS
jgi:hypothetical protein